MLSTGCLRGFIADYGVPVMILVWSAVSYSASDKVPAGVPRRLFSPNPWGPGASSNWTIIRVMSTKLVGEKKMILTYMAYFILLCTMTWLAKLS